MERPSPIAVAVLVVLVIVAAAAFLWAPNSRVVDSYTPTPEETELHGKLYSLAGRACRALDDAQLQHWAVGGTLLGAVRHRGMIPWDDDLDFGVWAADLKKVRSVLLDGLGKSARWVRSLRCYTVRMKDDPAVSLDIFPMERKRVGYEDVVRFASPLARSKWPREYIRAGEFGRWPLRRKFGTVTVPVIEHPCGFLDRAFPDWDRVGIVQRHSELLGCATKDGMRVRFDPQKSRRGCAHT